MPEITTIRFLDVEANEETTVVVHAGKKHVLLFICLTNHWDEEVYLSSEHCKCLVDALRHAIKELEHCAKLGHKGIQLDAFPSGTRIWATDFGAFSATDTFDVTVVGDGRERPLLEPPRIDRALDPGRIVLFG